MKSRLLARLPTVLFCALLLALAGRLAGGDVFAIPDPFPQALSSTIGAERFEDAPQVFLKRRGHMNWPHDKEVRSTGLLIDGENHGTHPAVRVYYSPEVYAWR